MTFLTDTVGNLSLAALFIAGWCMLDTLFLAWAFSIPGPLAAAMVAQGFGCVLIYVDPEAFRPGNPIEGAVSRAFAYPLILLVGMLAGAVLA